MMLGQVVVPMYENKIAILTFARFPSEMAYGIHLIQITNSFLKMVLK